MKKGEVAHCSGATGQEVGAARSAQRLKLSDAQQEERASRQAGP